MKLHWINLETVELKMAMEFREKIVDFRTHENLRRDNRRLSLIVP